MTTTVAVKVKKPVSAHTGKKSKKIASAVPFFSRALLWLLFFSACLMIKVYWQTQINENNLKLNSRTVNLAQMKKSNEELALQANLLKAPGRIYYLATTRLKMQKPETVTYLVMPVIKVERQRIKVKVLASRTVSEKNTVK